MKKLIKSASARYNHIPAIDVVVDNSDVETALDIARRSNGMPLHRRIKSDREFGVRSDVYPYEATFDDDAEVSAWSVDKDADIRRSKWTSYAEACKDNPSRVKQTDSAEAGTTSPAEIGKDNGTQPSQE